MIEVLLVPILMAAAAMFPKLKQNDRKIIEEVFKNCRYGISKGDDLITPQFKKKMPIKEGETEIGTTYLFSFPPGLTAGKVKETLFAEALGKPVEVEFKRGKGFYVHVFEEDIREFIPFKDVPEPLGKWTLPIGRTYKGWIWHNFEHVPHMTIAGTTRFGKSVLLRLILVYLILFQPDDIELYIIDLKGRLEFGKYGRLKQVKWVAGTPLEALAMLNHLTNEDPKQLGILEQEFEYFEKNYISNITETNIKKRRFIIVDEGAQLSPNKYTADNKIRELCQFKLSRIASLFGAIGVRLIFATQYPIAENLNQNVKMNADAKVSFRLPAGYASKVAIDDYGAEALPSDIKGRALMKTHELKEMQVPFIKHEEAWALLERYQDPQKVEGEPENVITIREEMETAREDISKPGANEIRDKRTDSKNSRVRFE